jgi:alpha-L-fucosidase
VHGVITIKGETQYVHVLTKPSGSTLKIRDNGYRVRGVTNLRTGAAIAFTQGSGSLTLTGLSGWDTYDTVFKVETAGRTGTYDPKTVTLKASASANGHSGQVASDGDYLTYFDNNKTLPVNLDYDLGSAKKSSDGNNWGSAVKSGTLPSHRGVQFVDLSAVTARYVRLHVTSTYAASSDSTRYKRLRIDETWLGSDYATAAG